MVGPVLEPLIVGVIYIPTAEKLSNGFRMSFWWWMRSSKRERGRWWVRWRVTGGGGVVEVGVLLLVVVERSKVRLVTVLVFLIVVVLLLLLIVVTTSPSIIPLSILFMTTNQALPLVHHVSSILSKDRPSLYFHQNIVSLV